MFYSVYSFPNFILPLFGGLMIDKMGIGISIIVFSSLLTAGQAVFAVGGFMANEAGFTVAIIGRVLFGLGGESLNVCQSTIVSRWFFGKELAFALGINITIS